jgi:polysaccharide biosynthesis transport protein
MQQNDNLRYYVGILRRRYPYFLAAFILAFGASVFVALKLPPIFRSEAKILVESQQIPAELVKSTVTGLAGERIEVTRQRITSREALLAIAEKYDLFPEQREKLSATQLVDVIRERILILPFDLGLTGRRSREGALTVAFTVGFEYEQANVAAKVANELVTLILKEDIRSRTSKANETTQFLNRETDRLQQELAKIDKTLSDFKLQNKDALPERVPFQLAALERAESDLKSLDRNIGDLSESRRFMELELAVRKSSQGSALNSNGQDPSRGLDSLKAELAQKSAIYSNSHPEIKALKSQIAALEKQYEAAASSKPDKASLSPEEISKLDLNSRIVAEKIDTIDRQLKLATSQKASIADAVKALNAVLGQAPEVQVYLSLLDRQRDGAQKALDEISGKLSEARLGEQLEKDQQAERFEIIEQPITPLEPVRPNRKKILTAGFFLAGLAGMGSVLGLELLNQSIRTSSDLVKAINRHPLVTIPYITTVAEGRRRKVRLLAGLLALLIFILVALVAIHFFYMPLDLLVLKIFSRLNI